MDRYKRQLEAQGVSFGAAGSSISTSGGSGPMKDVRQVVAQLNNSSDLSHVSDGDNIDYTTGPITLGQQTLIGYTRRETE